MVDQEIIEAIIEVAKDDIMFLDEDDVFMTKIYGVNEKGIGSCNLLPLPPGNKKYLMMEAAGAYQQQAGFSQNIFVSDTFYTDASAPLPPSDMPDSLRGSALMFFVWDFMQKDGFQCVMLPYSGKGKEIIWEKRQDDGTNFGGPMKDAFSMGFLKGILKQTISFEDVVQEASKETDFFDMMVKVMKPFFARLMDDYPFFVNSTALENWRNLHDPSMRVLIKEQMMEEMERLRGEQSDGEEDDRPWEK